MVSNTRILQAAVVRSEVGEDKQSVENALVINLGEATANTGLNKVIGVLSKHGEDYGIGGAAGTASIETGGATAVGVASSTLITQTVQAHATDGAFIVITQKGVVLNVGGAIANTGFNSATGVGALGLTGEQLAALTSLYQVLNALLEAGGWALPADGGAGGGSGNAVGDAQVSTGDALAVGADAVTTIIQDVNATADGGTIDASQSAVVANVGLGVANTGGNRAAGVSGGGAEEPEEPEERPGELHVVACCSGARRLLARPLGRGGRARWHHRGRRLVRLRTARGDTHRSRRDHRFDARRRTDGPPGGRRVLRGADDRRTSAAGHRRAHVRVLVGERQRRGRDRQRHEGTARRDG